MAAIFEGVKNMQKLIIGAMLIGMTLLLSSCSVGDSIVEKVNASGETGKAKARTEQIIDAINNKDRDAIMAMFSEKALSEAEDIDAGIDYLFSLFENDIESREWHMGAGSASYDHGNRTKRNDYYFNVYSGEKEYRIYIREDTVDTEHPENVGVYTIWATDTDEKDENSTIYGIGGIYVPFDEDGAAHARFEKLLKLIKDKDKDAIRALFSEEALREARDINGEIDALLDLFPNGIDSWEQESGYANRQITKSSKYINCYYVYTVYADGEAYWIKIDEFLERTSMPESVGVGYIIICRPEAEHPIHIDGGITFLEE